MPSEKQTHLLDTNIILRFLLGDDPKQSKIVNKLMTSICDGQTLAQIKDFVLLETVWVLDASFHIPHDEIADKLINILNFTGITNSNRSILIRALLDFKEKNIDLADCLLAAYSSPSMPVVSFDKDLKRLRAHLAEF